MQMDEGKKKEKKINKTIGWNDREGKKKSKKSKGYWCGRSSCASIFRHFRLLSSFISFLQFSLYYEENFLMGLGRKHLSSIIYFSSSLRNQTYSKKVFHPHYGPVWYMCLKTENCCLKTFVEIRVGEKVYWNAWNVV